MLTASFSIAVIEQTSSDDLLVYLLVIITIILAFSLIALFTILCKLSHPPGLVECKA